MRELASRRGGPTELQAALRVHDEALEPDGVRQTAPRRGWRPDAWETTYMHLLGGPDPVLGWVRGTGLRPIVAALRPQDRAEDFEAEYARQLREALPAGDSERASQARDRASRGAERAQSTDSAEQSGTALGEVHALPVPADLLRGAAGLVRVLLDGRASSRTRLVRCPTRPGHPDAARPHPDQDRRRPGERTSRGGILIPATAEVAKRLVWGDVARRGAARAVGQGRGPRAFQSRGPVRGRGRRRDLPGAARA